MLTLTGVTLIAFSGYKKPCFICFRIWLISRLAMYTNFKYFIYNKMCFKKVLAHVVVRSATIMLP